MQSVDVSPIIDLDTYYDTEEHPEITLAREIGRFYDDPLGFVKFAYPWGEGELEGFHGPMQWQADLLNKIGEEVRDRGFDVENPIPVMAQRHATASGHGIGKSAITAWITDWIMSTRPFARGTVTANTSAQLESKTWAEIAKWTKRLINAHWFKVNTGRGSMRMYHLEHAESWYCKAETCREENSESFAGQHAANSTSFYIFDEASAIPPVVWEVAEGGLTDGEPMFFAFGNPTRNTGKFKDIFGEGSNWNTRNIDSREVDITNDEQLDEWIEEYGIDSDFVKVRILGVFPRLGSNQLISKEDVKESVARIKALKPDMFSDAPVIIGVDVAWEGDDKHVVVKRQGMNSEILGLHRHLPNETMGLANLVAYMEDEHAADAVFVDSVGVGAGVIDRLREMGRKPIAANVGVRADEPKRFKNKRAECWWRMREWIHESGVLPKNPELEVELTGPEYTLSETGQIVLERKKDMKKRGLKSPDIADALAITFYSPVRKKSRTRVAKGAGYNVATYGIKRKYTSNDLRRR